MQMSNILNLLKSYLLLGIAVILFISIIFLIGYGLIYRKIMNGRKTINKKRLFLYGIMICYLTVLIGAVFLSRNAGVYGDVNLHLFSSYKEAYHKMKESLFWNIILNILLFVPMGFLLPFYSDKLKRIYKIVPLGFFVTLLIEIIQYVLKLGIFEMDDIFNNTLGTLIGYCIFMIFYHLKNKIYKKYTTLYILPVFITIFAFWGIYIKYQRQEFGNLEFQYNYTVNMKNVNIENKVSFSKETQTKPVYYKKRLTETETKEIAEHLFKRLGTEINENDTMLYEDTAIYKADSYSLWIDYIDGSYSYSDFSESSGGTILPVKQGESRENIEKALKQFGIELPKSVEFKEIKENHLPYTFTVNMEFQDNQLQNGSLQCAYYEDGTIKNITNHIITYNKIKESEIISEETAYNEILAGHFRYSKTYMGKLENIVIKDIKIQYVLDTKGYYVPVYAFEVEINGQKTAIYIKAVKNL